MHRFGSTLGVEEFGQLKGWLRSSALETLMQQLPPPPPPPDETAASGAYDEEDFLSAATPSADDSTTAAAKAGDDVNLQGADETTEPPASPSRQALPPSVKLETQASSTTPQKPKADLERSSNSYSGSQLEVDNDLAVGSMDHDGDPAGNGAHHQRSKQDQARAAAAFDAELSRQLFLDQIAGTTAPPHQWPLHETFTLEAMSATFEADAMVVEDDYSHYDTPLGLTPTPLPRSLPPHLAAHLAAVPAKAVDGTNGHGDAKPAPSASAGADSGNASAGGTGVTQAYGEGLAVLLSHLAASRPPQVAAWLQLKEEQRMFDEEALEEGGWDDLNELEEAFIHTNAAHLAHKSWLNA